MPVLGSPEIALEFLDHLASSAALLERGDRREEVAFLCKPLRADRAELGQPEGRAIVLAHIAAHRLSHSGLELDAARDHRNFSRFYFNLSQFSRNQERTDLRNEHQLAID